MSTSLLISLWSIVNVIAKKRKKRGKFVLLTIRWVGGFETSFPFMIELDNVTKSYQALDYNNGSWTCKIKFRVCSGNITNINIPPAIIV